MNDELEIIYKGGGEVFCVYVYRLTPFSDFVVANSYPDDVTMRYDRISHVNYNGDNKGILGLFEKHNIPVYRNFTVGESIS